MIIISVVIPTRNRQELLEKCLNALFCQTYPRQNFEILVCDDGSDDGTKRLVFNLRNRFKNLRYIHQKRQNQASARNLGIKAAKGEIIAFTDDDCLPDKKWLEKIADCFKKHPNLLGVEGKTIPDVKSGDLFVYQLINENGAKYWTCNIAYKKKALSDIGGFDKLFFHHEDTDLAYRILRNGKIAFNPPVLIIHPSKKIGFFSGLTKLSYLSSDFRLYQKHRNYLNQSFPVENELVVFFLIAFAHLAFYRLRLIKASLGSFPPKPGAWFKLLLKNLLEIVYIIFVFPAAVLKTRTL